ncbi:hypothetical protein DLAC_06531 [Tieghemostelium lacteum]|uniref:B box-type domain-containing protein n=1 Tax=Tieghemostelium lacteum TaxID=361077 RepID=A0A151ZF48_TIELA|nr:hypothetical protein DLAC_06531 [Tieghemostelium lacteum]|eukprot:KYQ92539.1 hypothetical protein DLAC_06531 [Tieghemostelium lacteum]
MIENNECSRFNHSKKVTGFCTKCSQLVCNSCVTKSHPNHNLIDPDEVESSLKNTHIKRFNEKKEEYTSMKKLIKDHFVSLHDELHIKEVSLMKELDSNYNDMEDIFNINIQSIEELDRELKSNTPNFNDKQLLSPELYTLNVKLNYEILENTKNIISKELEITDYFNEGYKFLNKIYNHVTLSKNNKTATVCVGDGNIYSLLTIPSFKNGIQHLKIRIDKISGYIFLGVTNLDNLILYATKKIGSDEGISSNNLDGFKSVWVDGDIFSLILNCDEGTLKIRKESTGEFKLIQNIQKNAPTNFIVRLLKETTSVTILN